MAHPSHLFEYKVTVEGPTKETSKLEHYISADGYKDAQLRAHEFFGDEGNIVSIDLVRQIF